ncbi:hypothetical protein C2845_PMPSC016550 [Panicum miliaceum]|uniref:Uncharacterized protein n=1 Tax=Panicum miliaceum TaxID=4540 RepID=A0A3L6P9S4_PANMI|nr:hypothetical protein C2845_PMPSC016550 [Panicum miliaceum]
MYSLYKIRQMHYNKIIHSSSILHPVYACIDGHSDRPARPRTTPDWSGHELTGLDPVRPWVVPCRLSCRILGQSTSPQAIFVPGRPQELRRGRAVRRPRAQWRPPLAGFRANRRRRAQRPPLAPADAAVPVGRRGRRVLTRRRRNLLVVACPALHRLRAAAACSLYPPSARRSGLRATIAMLATATPCAPPLACFLWPSPASKWEPGKTSHGSSRREGRGKEEAEDIVRPCVSL